ncbi:hypothetical protein FRC12_021863, partial [Ceratobasidium sp. 428]
MVSRFTTVPLAAVFRSTLHCPALRSAPPRTSSLPWGTEISRRGIVMPSFSDIFRGRFAPSAEESPSETVREEPKKEQPENTSLFDVAEQQAPQPRKKHTQA